MLTNKQNKTKQNKQKIMWGVSKGHETQPKNLQSPKMELHRQHNKMVLNYNPKYKIHGYSISMNLILLWMNEWMNEWK